ncbi:MAG: Calx-beta domain-containing protein [Chthoniobacteraceae bacterium]
MRLENPEPVPAPATDAPLADFSEWTARYLAAAPSERPAFIAEGIQLAEAHRTALADLIPRDPKRAIESAIPMVVRQDLPPEILDRLEERISAKGFFGVLGVVGQPVEEQSIRREVRLANQERYEVHTYGTRLTQTTTPDTNLTGIAIDGSLALSERGFRVLEIGERLDPARPVFNTCPVSGKSSGISPAGDGTYPSITKDTPAVEIAGEVHYLCDGRHINVLAEGGTGGPTKPTTTITTTTSTGVRSVLYIRVAFPETRKEPQTEAAAYDMMRQVNDFMVENSYGNLYLLTTVTPLVIVPRTEAFYKGGGGDESVLQTDAQTAARNLGYDFAKYDHDIVAYNGGPGTFGGLGYVGSRGIWIRTITVGVTSHELGHNLGLWHANSWDTGGASTIGSGANVEYGNVFDTMGTTSAGDRHFNAAHKDKLNWLPRQSFVHQVYTSGTYRIHAFDQPRLDPGSRYALMVQKDRGRQYRAEFRQKSFGGNTWIRDGILLNWNPWTDSNGGTHLLDTTPGSPDDRLDAGIVIGRTFSDIESGIHITPIGKGGTTPESMDVVVNLGAFPGNQPPTAIVNAGTLSTEIGTPVSFTVTASDPDGDALSYAWDFGDKTFSNTNSASVSKSWAAAGEYVVRCVVSDMKGHTASDSAVVHVGAPATFRVSGQITIDGQRLADVRVSNGLTGASYIGTSTDSDGSYTLTGLTAGSLTVTPALYGYTFTTGFTNPVTVGPDFTAADFTATKAVAVTLTVSDSDCVEGNTDTGSFRLTRTGPTTSPLNVTCFNPPRGSAAAGFDYTFAPTALPSSSSLYYTVTIPADQSSLDIIVTAIDDTQLEGPETVTLELVARSGYVIGGAESETLTIQDSDTALPLVTLSPMDGDASEAGDTASFLVTRTGSTATSLAVNFTVSGTSTATQGVDYATIGTQLTIPAGSSSALLVITPINDTIAEGTETVTVSLASGAGYIPTGVSTENMGTVNILDDDLATVTVTASDNSAGETSGDTGTFLITRTGPTTLPLTVNYAIGGSATHGVDYERLPGVLTIPAGASTGSVTVLPIDDGIGEPPQTVTLQLRGGITHVVGNPGIATVNLIDNPDPPVVTVGVSNGVIGEPATAGSFRFTTTGSGDGNVTIHYTVTGTATPGIDYVALSGTLSMGRNATADVTVTPIDDSLPEDSETITVTIVADPAYTSFLDNTATLNLVDDDQPTVSISSTNSAFGEAGGIGRFWISRTGSTSSALAVNYVLSGTATNGDDYSLLPGNIVIPAGASGISLFITPINDTLIEGTETVIATLAPGAYGIGFASGTQYLTDNETLTVKVKFGSATGSSSESAGIVNIPIIMTAPAAVDVTVECVINGGSATGRVDYSFSPGIVTFLAGETLKYVPLTILDDVFNEPDETVLLRLQNPNGAALPAGGFPPTNNFTYTHTIIDNDSLSPPTAGFAAVSGTGVESQSSTTIAVSLSRPQAGPVLVDYSATGGSATLGADYSLPSGTLIFAAGETVKMFTLSIIDDTLSELSETILISVTNPVGATLGANATYTYTIEDDDGAEITIVASDPIAGEFGDDIGVFTLTRTGSLVGTLTAGIAVSGTADSGVDFQALPASVAFPASVGTATVEVHPLADSLAEGDETVIVTIVPDASFTIGAQDHAMVTIRDLPIDGWRFAKFGAWANTPLIAGDLANPDLDSFPNLLEFALSSEPNNTASATPPIFAIEGTDAALTYSRPSAVGDVTFTIEKWSAPDNWPAVTFSEEIVSEYGGAQVVKDRVPLHGATEMMLRLRVSRPAQ